MWFERLLSVVFCWYGTSMVAVHAWRDGVEASFVSVLVVAGGTMLVLSGVWMVAGGWRLPEDDGTKIVPPAWPYYLAAAGFGVGAVINTLGMMGVIRM